VCERLLEGSEVVQSKGAKGGEGREHRAENSYTANLMLSYVMPGQEVFHLSADDNNSWIVARTEAKEESRGEEREQMYCTSRKVSNSAGESNNCMVA
jgi:hypothetical protein